jgi:hypothetical protein
LIPIYIVEDANSTIKTAIFANAQPNIHYN